MPFRPLETRRALLRLRGASLGADPIWRRRLLFLAGGVCVGLAAVLMARLADIAQAMLRDALDAYVNRDVALAQRVLNEDDTLDSLKTLIFRELLTIMLNDPSTIEGALDLILVSRHLERIGDHATNVAEDVIFMVSARDVRHHAPEPDLQQH